jgi:hypothetical protein
MYGGSTYVRLNSATEKHVPQLRKQPQRGATGHLKWPCGRGARKICETTIPALGNKFNC